MIDTRAQTHLKAVIDETKRASDELDAGDSGIAKAFVSGMLAGLSVAYRIVDGVSAEDAMEQLVVQIQTAVGRSYPGGVLIPTEET